MKKVLSILMALALVFSMFTVCASAAEETEIVDSVVISSILNLSDDAVSAPSLTYTYTLTDGEQHTYTTIDDTSVVIFAGDADVEASTTEETVTYAVTDYATTDHTVTKTIEISFLSSAYTVAGVYHYVLTESTESELSTLVNDADSTRDIYVTVLTDANDELYVSKVIMTTEMLSDTTYAKSSSYTHSYGIDPDEANPGDPGSESTDFIVSEYTFGTLANKSQEFDFDITTTAEEGTVYLTSEGTYIIVGADGVLYTADKGEDVDTGATTFTSSGYELAVALADGDTFTILSVGVDTAFTVEISEPSELGYSFENRVYGETSWATNEASATYTILDNGEAVQGLDFAAVKGSDNDDEDDEDIDYTGSLPDTGVILEFTPYILMVLLAAAYLVLRVFKTGKKVRA